MYAYIHTPPPFLFSSIRSLPFPLSYPHNHDPTVPIKEGLRNVQDVIEKRQMGESTRRETAKTVQELLQKLQALKKLIDSKNVDQLASVRSARAQARGARRRGVARWRGHARELCGRG